MELLLDLFVVALAVQLGETVEDVVAGLFGNGKAGAVVLREIRHVVEVVAEVEVAPAVGVGDGAIDFNQKLAEALEVGVAVAGVVEAVAERGEPDPGPSQNPPANGGDRRRRFSDRGGKGPGPRKRLKAVGRRVAQICLEAGPVGPRPDAVKTRVKLGVELRPRRKRK